MSPLSFNYEIKVKSAYEVLSRAVSLFQIYLDDKTPATSSEYYRAKSLLNEGKVIYEEILKESKKLLGPLPAYSAPEYQQWREETTRDVKLMLGDKVEYEEIKKMMLSDSCLPKLFSPEELEAYLGRYYDQQQRGKRKLENLKCRLVIARLNDLIHQAEDLFTQAKKKLQTSLAGSQ
ncbi:MAG: hypothetical protein PHU81_00730 [Acidobacteriota bacterium]|nr:hypothetical protein [Acidobacteriota bacterium]